ncbi:MAG TPA: hypothetical protein VGM08_01845 [Candidatus Saccharimonadales bacterium]|jgi:hypothetical protein
MIKTHSDDPDVKDAAKTALGIIDDILNALPKAETFDYGGHILKIGEYGVCSYCTTPIAEAQAAEKALLDRAHTLDDETVKEHLELAAQLFHVESEAASIRAELHNGLGSEQILNRLLGFAYDRHIGEDYQHSHHGGQE